MLYDYQGNNPLATGTDTPVWNILKQGVGSFVNNNFSDNPLGLAGGSVSPLVSGMGTQGQQSPQTNPQQAAVNHFNNVQQQAQNIQPLQAPPPDDQPLSFDTSGPKHSNTMEKVEKIASIAALFA